MTLTCQCTATDLPDTYKIAMAWVNPEEPYVINACEKFWQAPDIPTVRDENSRVGTIIHESVHFSDAQRGGSQAHYAVGYEDSENLAVTSRALAAKNPNTYKFFVLNQNW